MLRDLQGVLRFSYVFDNQIEALTLKPARDGHKGDLDREKEQTCQPRYSNY
jgi:hypothetical protein